MSLPSLYAPPDGSVYRDLTRDGMFGVGTEQIDDRFLLTVDDVFSLTGRGTAVIGPIRSGSIRSGDHVEVLHEGRVVATAHVVVEMITDRLRESNSIAIVLKDLTGDFPQPGDAIRHTVT